LAVTAPHTCWKRMTASARSGDSDRPPEPPAELLERTETYLASLPEDAAALRRQIAEARDGVARALKVQAADI